MSPRKLAPESSASFHVPPPIFAAIFTFLRWEKVLPDARKRFLKSKGRGSRAVNVRLQIFGYVVWIKRMNSRTRNLQEVRSSKECLNISTWLGVSSFVYRLYGFIEFTDYLFKRTQFSHNFRIYFQILAQNGAILIC